MHAACWVQPGLRRLSGRTAALPARLVHALRPSSARHLPLPLPQDIYTLFHLNRDFKFISKTSNFLIPIIGWSMFLTGGGRGPPTQSGIPAPVLLLRAGPGG